MTDRATEVAERVIAELNDRKGFDGWFGDIDADIKQEIRDSIAALIRPILDVEHDAACEACAATADALAPQPLPPCNGPGHDERWCGCCNDRNNGAEIRTLDIAAACRALKRGGGE